MVEFNLCFLHVEFFLCFRGIPFVSKDRTARMKAIAEELASGKYDIVCLQEVWTVSDFNLIRDGVKSSLPYSHYFHRYGCEDIPFWHLEYLQ